MLETWKVVLHVFFHNKIVGCPKDFEMTLYEPALEELNVRKSSVRCKRAVPEGCNSHFAGNHHKYVVSKAVGGKKAYEEDSCSLKEFTFLFRITPNTERMLIFYTWLFLHNIPSCTPMKHFLLPF